MNIWEIDKEMQAIAEMMDDEELVDLDTGEVISVEDALARLNMAREAKIENAALMVKNMTAEAAAIRSEEKKLAERRKALENKAESVKRYLLAVLYPEGGVPESYESARVRVSARLNNPAVAIDDESALPDVFWRETVKREPDKVEIMEVLKRGIAVPGAHMERSRRVDIK